MTDLASDQKSGRERLEASASSYRIAGKARKRYGTCGSGGGKPTVACEGMIEHLFEVDPLAMCLHELRSNDWRQINRHAIAMRIKSPKMALALHSLSEIEIDRCATFPPIA